MDEKELTVEEYFEELEEVLKKLEEPRVKLEESFALYEKGMSILKRCNEKIDFVEKKMQILNEDGSLEEM